MDYKKIYNRANYLDTIEGSEDFKSGGISFIKSVEIELLNINPGDHFLDIGCGRGEVAKDVLKLTNNVNAIDISQAAVDHAKSLCGDKATIKQEPATLISFKNGSMDKILCGDVIEHLTPEDAKKMVDECKRLLRKEGKLLIHTAPNTNFMNYIFYPGYRLLNLIGIKIASFEKKIEEEKLYHINTYTPKRLQKEVSLTGMTIEMLYPIGLLRSGKHYMLSNPLISVLAKIIDPLSRLPVIRDIFVNDIFVLLTK